MKYKEITNLFNIRRSRYLDFCERTEELGRQGILNRHYDPTESQENRINSVTYRKNRYCYHAFSKFPEKDQFIKDVASYISNEYGNATLGDNWHKGKIFVKPEGTPQADDFLNIQFGWRCYDPKGYDTITLFSRRNQDGMAVGYLRTELKCKDGTAQEIAKQIIKSIKLRMSMIWGKEIYPKGIYLKVAEPYKHESLFDQDGNYIAENLALCPVNGKINFRSNERYRHTVDAWEAFEAERMDVDEYYAYRRLRKKYKTTLRYKQGEDAISLCRAYDRGQKYFKGSTFNNFDFQRDMCLDDIPMDGDVDQIYDSIMSIALS